LHWRAVYSHATVAAWLDRAAGARATRPPPRTGNAQTPSPPKPPGARVARVAVDDATWAAFRALCGTTPASIRLGQLVDADVRRAKSSPDASADAALAAIRAQVDALEALLIAGGGEIRQPRA
jgi:hypothetical protein